MKVKNWMFVIMLLSIGFVQCVGEESSSEDQVLNEEEQQDAEKLLDHIKMLNNDLAGGGKQNEQVTATALFNAASKFANTYPSHEKTPAVMELAAKASEIIGKPQQAINIMQKLVDEFPNAEQAPKYMSNLGRLYEEKGELENAKATYQKLIDSYPDDPFAIDAQNYMTNILGKSDAELLMFFDSVNAQN
ncbi:MAG: tetratricopeptide repeat protein [Flavobacteriales bacterium]|nr:tetratricopeptide repeat protein [Flavobacteriales bacterium]MCB9195461.1 tetratricopeptide repeat protein [Flavobacteriales bacterium]MCB9198365.1 tetratricopeptide repeat protein [Flavobacteriales bacterium]